MLPVPFVCIKDQGKKVLYEKTEIYENAQNVENIRTMGKEKTV